MSFFYECTIPFNGIQQTIRVLHLRAAQSLLENQQHWPRDSHWVLSLAEGSFFHSLLHPNTHKWSGLKKIKPNFSPLSPCIFPQKCLSNTTNILAFQRGILSPGSILGLSFPHHWSHLPQDRIDWGIRGGWIEQNGFDFQKWDKYHLPFPNTEVWGRIHLQVISLFLSPPGLQRVRALVSICSAWMEDQHGLSVCIQHFTAWF